MLGALGSSVMGDVTRYLPHLLGFLVVSLGLIGLLSLGMRRATRAEVDQPGLWGLIGRMGSGKTLLQAYMAQRALTGTYRLKCADCLALGPENAPPVCDRVSTGPRPVYANFWVDGAERVGSWDELLSVPFGSRKDDTVGALVLIDEMPLWWPSAAWRIPLHYHMWLSHLRKRKITCIWSSQHVAHVGKKLVELSFGIWNARRLVRLHEYTLWDREDYGRRGAKSLGRYRVHQPRKLWAIYDTEEAVSPACSWYEQPRPAPPTPAVAAQPRPDGKPPALTLVEAFEGLADDKEAS